MKNAVGLILFSTLALCGCTRSGLQVADAWVRLPPPGAHSAAAYLTLDNHGPVDVTLTGAEVESFATSMIHTTRIEDGMSRMLDAVPLSVRAGASVQFEPGALHIMLMGPSRVLTEGDEIEIRLLFANREPLQFTAAARRMAP